MMTFIKNIYKKINFRALAITIGVSIWLVFAFISDVVGLLTMILIPMSLLYVLVSALLESFDELKEDE